MNRLIVFIGLLIAVFSGGVVAARAIGTTIVDSGRFSALLARDSVLIDGQWRWREVFPGRDSMEYARLLLEKNGAGFFVSTTGRAETRFEMLTSDGWMARVYRDNELPPPHVYSVVLNTPAAAPGSHLPTLTLGEVILQFGVPVYMSNLPPDSRTLCFVGGMCTTLQFFTPRASIWQPIAAIAFVPSAVVSRGQRQLAPGNLWHGFTRYFW